MKEGHYEHIPNRRQEGRLLHDLDEKGNIIETYDLDTDLLYDPSGNLIGDLREKPSTSLNFLNREPTFEDIEKAKEKGRTIFPLDGGMGFVEAPEGTEPDDIPKLFGKFK